MNDSLLKNKFRKPFQIVLIFLLSALVSGCVHQPKVTHAPTNLQRERPWPKTLNEAVEILISELSSTDKETIKAMKKEDLIRFHFGWGTRIRNEFGLWAGNTALLKSCNASHPDDASGVIIESVWKRLQEDGDGP